MQLQPADEETWDEIEVLIHEIADLAKSQISTHQFYRDLLDRAVRALAAEGGAVWMRGTGGDLALEYQINLAKANLGSTDDSQPSHQEIHTRLLQSILDANEPRIVPPRSGSDIVDPETVSGNGTERSRGNSQSANPTEFLLLAAPVAIDDGAIGIVEVLQRTGASPAAQSGYLSFLAALCELAADFHRNDQRRDLQNRAALWGQFEQFAERAHRSLDLDTTAYSLANDGRQLIGCDRASVGIFRGRKFRLLAASGIDTVDRRSNVVRRLQELVQAVAAIDEPFWYHDDPSELPIQIDEPLQAYLDESQARMLAILPLKSNNQADSQSQPATIGALVVEQFESDQADRALRQRTHAVCQQAELSLRNSLQYHDIPLRPIVHGLQRIGWLTRARQLPKTVLAVLLFVAVVAALVLIPADFVIEGRGELQPKLRRDVFATSDGIVEELRVEHSQPVRADDPLIVLRKSELDFEFSRVLGETQTARKRLNTVQTARLETNPANASATERYNRLTAEEEELKSQLKSLDRQHAVLLEQRAELEIRSPINGHILTWNVEQLLATRPVKRGQKLLTVADLAGTWQLEMRVADEDIGHVKQARKEFGPNLDVSFIVATDPNVTYQGTVEDVAVATELDDSGEATVLVTVRIDAREIAGLRPGATVIPKISCGRQPIGYVWLHDLIDAIRTRVLF